MKEKTYAVAFAYSTIKELQNEVNDFLGKDNVEYVDLKYAVDNNGSYNIYSAILIYRYANQNRGEW